MSRETHDKRLQLLKHWLQNDLGLEISDFQPASEDASFRRYFRVLHTQGQHIVMDAPPASEKNRSFIDVAAILKQTGIHSPDILAHNLTEGFMLLEDLGQISFFDRLNPETAESLYQSAFDCLFKLHSQLPAAHLPLPPYDAALLQNELDIFYHWFAEHHCGVPIPSSLQQQLNACLIHSALEQPVFFVHRDFHCRNLMVVPENSPGVIDFQDAVTGPVTYDLVSLLRDCYQQWPDEHVEDWLNHYYQRLLSAGLIQATASQFKRWFDLMGLQRHLKAIGIFARLHYRDNKPGYLADIPRTLRYIRAISQSYPELAEFDQFLTQTLLPQYPEPL